MLSLFSSPVRLSGKLPGCLAGRAGPGYKGEEARSLSPPESLLSLPDSGCSLAMRGPDPDQSTPT